jgi:hypothetical protein
VASNSSNTVVTLASCSVNAMAWKSSALKFMPTLYRALLSTQRQLNSSKRLFLTNLMLILIFIIFKGDVNAIN